MFAGGRDPSCGVGTERLQSGSWPTTRVRRGATQGVGWP
ncbi:uncharacterized protein HBSAL_00990 [Halobacterium salinarum]|uniref:Uncharacterized protein n=1 Tax=Halobacterium salinarum (strain ATCC 33171 / DSM 3754 / JCM 8978 / NBRC 102687 / NCIMB 764 / 91-R6) TaxID=2597657 RepID=A0A4D6GQH6_HALS9|nr:uncharacterized protein HBSAL_00990 [Halobacterium salinarum]